MSNRMTQCPHCKEEFEVGSGLIGHPTICPFCRRNFTIAIRVRPADDSQDSPNPPAPQAVPGNNSTPPPDLPKIPVLRGVSGNSSTPPPDLPKIPVLRGVPGNSSTTPPDLPKIPVLQAVPGNNNTPPPDSGSRPAEQSEEPGASSRRSYKWQIVGVCILGGLLLLIAAGAFGYQHLRAKKSKAEEEVRIKAEEEARIRAEQEQAKEAERKAAEEERTAARQARQQTEAEKESEEGKRLDEIKQRLSKSWDTSLRENLGDKLFIAVTSPKKSGLLLFLYDSELESLVDKVLSVRNRIVRYNRLMKEAVFEDGLGDQNAVAKLCRDGLEELEGKSEETKREITDLSEKIAYLTARKKLLVRKFELPENGYLDEEIPPGKYLIVYLPEREVGCEYVFEKEKKLPLALAAEKNRWHNVSGHFRYFWDPKRECTIEVNKNREDVIRLVVERNGRWRVKEEP